MGSARLPPALPKLSEQELQEAAENLTTYFEVMWRIYQRQTADGSIVEFKIRVQAKAALASDRMVGLPLAQELQNHIEQIKFWIGLEPRRRQQT